MWKCVYIQSFTRMMNRTGMICIFLAFLVELNASSQALTKGLICVTDYRRTISCSLKLTVTPTRNTSYWLEFKRSKDLPYICPLQRAREDHTCSFTVVKTMANFHAYNVTLHYLENGSNYSSLLDDDFRPAKNIKPKAPFNLTLQHVSGTYRFVWKNGYEDHPFKNALPIMYKFLYYKDGENESEVSVHPNTEMIQIDEMKLDPGTTYTAMVRTGIHKDKTYNGTWSDWSRTVKWNTAYRDESSQVSKIVIGTVLILGLLILLPAVSFKMKEISLVPTPATYFQPLYQNYQGNFQCWVLAKSPLQNIHVIEDFSTVDKISEVISTLQDQVEKTGMYPAAQCHQPYVGPTAEVWAPRQIPNTCSETSIPCEEFSLFCEVLPDEVDDFMQSLSVACLSGDVLCLNDSALSLESLEDFEASEAPVIINPTPMRSKQDYCTLTDIPTSPVPTIARDIELDENTFRD
ncbi:interleukin 21 receptor, tandem duplicate 2 [Rhinichthys klamathensis goyatoka]|uniref:interleukin 21 receptor, tandem duplicate 2 n=1 Tax=Rhinichthys klamathensis goyatoka TaxID=3034132 RepID=UPI0024B5A7B2|nr:interleukin 21 receptor, tandem duplicate 2 [Rhinichthys klamathensis goyatoka]